MSLLHLVLAMHNKKVNFFGEPLADVVKHVEKGYKMEAPEGCLPEVYEIMRQAWDLQPEKRPSFKDVKAKLVQLKLSTV